MICPFSCGLVLVSIRKLLVGMLQFDILIFVH